MKGPEFQSMNKEKNKMELNLEKIQMGFSARTVYFILTDIHRADVLG